jgi:TM2 domain-containing membrane protein YozV
VNKLEYLQALKSIRDSVPPDRRDNFDLQFGAREKDPAVALALSLYFGWFGVDRFYLGNILLGILKLITLGGWFVWAFIDWFLIMGSARRANARIALEAKNIVGTQDRH